MTNERKPVDVLAVMKVDAIAAEEWRFKQAGDAFAFAACKTSNEARAAVAELIRLTLAIDAECGNAKPDFGKVCALSAEAAALARCGGA